MGPTMRANVSCRKNAARRIWMRAVLAILALAVLAPPFLTSGCPAPAPSEPLQARLELAAGEVGLEQDGATGPAFSGTALLPGARVRTGPGARALIRLSTGASLFMRGDSKIELTADTVSLGAGEAWLDAPPAERDAVTHAVGEVTVYAVDAGLSIKRTDDGAVVYVARGEATVTAPGGRVEVRAGEQAAVSGQQTPQVQPVAFWEDWTGGMADHGMAGALAGAGRIYGVDRQASPGSPARRLEISRQSVRAVLRAGLAETEVDQTFFNPGDRPVEGWYWFKVPAGASVTAFAVETNGVLVEGEFIERRQAAARYEHAVQTGHAPAILEWIDDTTFRARIFPVPPAGTRRVVLRYLELLPYHQGTLRYLYPLRGDEPVRIGEFALTVDLGPAGQDMQITTLADARVEAGGQRVTMRRSGYVPRADFLLEAALQDPPPPVRVARMSAGTDTADYLMVRYVPDFSWTEGNELRGEVVLVVDTSADTGPTGRSMKMRTAEAVLRALSAEDRFALVALDVRPVVLFPDEGLAGADERAIGAALERLAEHASGGATDLAALFDVSLQRLHDCEQPAIIYVGDGIATSGETDGAELTERLDRALSTSRARLFTVGVGAHAHRSLLDNLARAGGGESFQIDATDAVCEQALQLVSALKTPTLTEFSIDLGAGLDEVFVSANGKVKHGEEVVVLGRTHHPLPATVKVRGRLRGQELERSYTLAPDDSVADAFVARLWAATYLRRMLGTLEDPELHRGKIMQMGIDYGLMTPYTSILALESEAAYRRQGIQRRSSPLRGVRLSQLATRRGTSGRGSAFGVVTGLMGYGCDSQPQAMSEQVAPAVAAREAPPQPAGGAAMASHPSARRKMAAPRAERRLAAPRDEMEAAPAPAMEAKAEPADDRPARARQRRPEGIQALRQACSDASSRSLRERVILWRKRMRSASGPGDLIARYEAARASCELPDWRSEAAFFRVLRSAIRDEGTAVRVLAHFSDRPGIQRHLARLILRRTVDARIIAAVENLLFQQRVNWASVDSQLAQLPDVERRIARLREILAQAPNDPNGIMRLVHLLVEAGKLEEALVQGRRLRDAGLITPLLARELGDVLASHGLDAEAVRTYSEIVEFDPDNLASRRLLGDIYLAHGWFEPACRQYRTLTEEAGDNPLFWLRLARAEAGAGRVDRALRIERQVASAPGRPGPDDPRRWAKLWSASRLAQLLNEPPQGKDPARMRESIQSRLKELQLFRGQGSLVVLTWRDPSADVLLATMQNDTQVAAGEPTDAARTGLSAVLLAPGERERVALRAVLRSPASSKPLQLARHDIHWDGKNFQVEVSELTLPANRTSVDL